MPSPQQQQNPPRQLDAEQVLASQSDVYAELLATAVRRAALAEAQLVGLSQENVDLRRQLDVSRGAQDQLSDELARQVSGVGEDDEGSPATSP